MCQCSLSRAVWAERGLNQSARSTRGPVSTCEGLNQDIPLAVAFGSAGHRRAHFLGSSVDQEEL